ncbi:MAG: HD domain-containing protein [Rubrivivax sp.]|nr:HD domain-containing protein [Rubrivivax sp.]
MALRLAELLGALSLATDLANGLAPEHGLRIALVAARLAEGDSAPAARDAYWTGLLRYLGCNAFAVEEARFAAGDDIGLRSAFVGNDIGRPAVFLRTALREVGRGAPPLARLRGLAALLTSPGAPKAHAHAQCEAALVCGRKLGMEGAVLAALAAVDERWDGSGLPEGLAREALPPAQRHVEVARIAVALHSIGGAPAVLPELARRAGGHLDPALVARFTARAPALLDLLAPDSVWDAFLDAEPGRWLVGEEQLDALAEAFALMADLKSGWFAGHSHGVAALARDAALGLGLGEHEARLVWRAGLLHDLGALAVPTGLWDKPGPLSAAEWERVHLHSYWTDRALRRAPALAPLADAAGRVHERLDGSGYHRGEGATLPLPARLLAAADIYRACTEARAWRAALPPGAAAQVLDDEVAGGRLCPRAAQAVRAAAGHGGHKAPGERARGAAGDGARSSDDEDLSPREHEVLRWLVRGLTNKEIAKALAISPRTVQHHTIHIYAKAGVKSRAGVGLWAVQRGLFG